MISVFFFPGIFYMNSMANVNLLGMKISERQLVVLMLVLMLVYFVATIPGHSVSASQIDYDKYRRIRNEAIMKVRLKLLEKVSERAAYVAQECVSEYANSLNLETILTNPDKLTDTSYMQNCLRQKAYKESPEVARELLSADILPIIMETMQEFENEVVDDIRRAAKKGIGDVIKRAFKFVTDKLFK